MSSVVRNVPLKATRLKRWMQTESLWNRKEVSRFLPVEREVRLPISPMKSSADQLYWPKVSIKSLLLLLLLLILLLLLLLLLINS